MAGCVRIWYKGYGWLCKDMVQGVWLVVYGMVQGVWSCMDMVQGVIMIVVCGYRPRNIVMGLFYENVSSSFANCVIKTTNQPVLKVDLFVFPLTCLSFRLPDMQQSYTVSPSGKTLNSWLLKPVKQELCERKGQSSGGV